VPEVGCLKTGQSICPAPEVISPAFMANRGGGKVLIGEVSMVNDDDSDNRFLDETGRFPAIEEDVEPVHLLVKIIRNIYNVFEDE